MYKILITTLTLVLISACGTTSPYRCTSLNTEICNLQQRMVRIEDRLQYPRKPAPVVMTDKELIDELNRRKRARTYAIPDK